MQRLQTGQIPRPNAPQALPKISANPNSVEYIAAVELPNGVKPRLRYELPANLVENQLPLLNAKELSALFRICG
jgi:hypothetical protein